MQQEQSACPLSQFLFGLVMTEYSTLAPFIHTCWIRCCGEPGLLIFFISLTVNLFMYYDLMQKFVMHGCQKSIFLHVHVPHFR